jgi:energy-converting hydrogenase Eha subunit G
LSTSAEEQATSFFFRNYVLEEQKYHNGHFQYLSDIYAREEIGESLADSVVCLGLVGLANFWKASNILISAKAKYNSALRLVSSKLRNIEEAKSDQTMAAVMLLGVYEVLLHSNI